VNLLFLMDTHNYNPVKPGVSVSEKVVNAGAENNVESPGSTRPEIKSQPDRTAGNLKLAFRKQIEKLRIAVEQIFRLNSHRDISGTREEHISRINDQAFLSYAPSEYSGKITVCQPRRRLQFLRDPLNGWGGVAAQGLEIIEIAVDPGAIFVKPYVQQLAEILREKLAQATPVPDASVEVQVRIEMMDKSKLALLADK
jgi:hypothetical protein